MPDRQIDPAQKAWLNQSTGAHSPQVEAVRRHVLERRTATRRGLVAAGLVLTAVIVWFVISAFLAHEDHVRWGNALLAAGTCVLLARLKSIWPGELSEGAPAEAWIAFQRDYLRRRRQSLVNRIVWGLGPMLPGVAMLVSGFSGPRFENSWPIAALVALWAAGWLVLHTRSTTRLDRELAELQQKEDA